MKFKNWLLEHEGRRDHVGDKGGSDTSDAPKEPYGWGWDLIYPSMAGDYSYEISKPKNFWYYQWRLKRGKEIGRPLYNIDPEIFERKFVNVFSKTMPNDKDWIHKSDDNSGSLGIEQNIDLLKLGFGDSHDKPMIMHGPMVSHGFDNDPPMPPHTAKPIPKIKKDQWW